MNTQTMRGVIRRKSTVTGTIRYVGHTGEGAPAYQGPYEIRPALEEQTVPTAGTVLAKDITVQKIPIETVSNTAGGNTAIIG